jgi:uncharacterized protein (DUF1778 family)
MARKMTMVERRTEKGHSKAGVPKAGRKVRKKKGVRHASDVYARSGRAASHAEPALQMNDAHMGAMLVRNEVKTARYEIRFTAQQLEVMEKASSILGYKNTTDYIRHVMQENTMKVIKDQVILQIAEHDRQRFMAELTSPSEPSEAFKHGVDLFNKTFKD